MNFKKVPLLTAIITGITSVLVITIAISTYFSNRTKGEFTPKIIPNSKTETSNIVSSNTPTPSEFKTYQPPQLPEKEAYTILLVGDSMTKSLGANSDQLRNRLAVQYPDTVFGIFNYGMGSTNVRNINQLLYQSNIIDGVKYPPILERQFDILIIESFGYNPLSDLGIEQGIKEQNRILTQTMKEIVNSHPDSLVIFFATIAPDLNNYGIGSIDLSSEQRFLWAEERRIYIENHIYFANQHKIPVIDVYHASMDQAGNTIQQYVDQGDHIHPSAAGVELMAAKIQEYFVNNSIIPN